MAPAKFEYQGKYYTLRELHAFAPRSVSLSMLRERLTDGWDVERAVKTGKLPLGAGGRKNSANAKRRVCVYPAVRNG